jgi:hypothetical protein
VLKQVRDGRLEQITERIDRIERELADIQELVTRMRDDETGALSVPEMLPSSARTVTSACWQPLPLIQEDSASL